MKALTEKGFQRPLYGELLQRQIARAKELFGDDVDTSEQAVLGKYLRILVDELARAYEELEAAYYARFPNTAQGMSLDRLLPFAGIRRNPAAAAVFRVELHGEPGYEIAPGFLVSTPGGTVFHTMAGAVLDEKGTARVLVECNAPGTQGNVPAASVSQIVNPDVGVASVLGVSLETPGANEETDAALRVRFARTIAGSGSGTPEAIRGEIMRVTGVTDCRIIANSTDSTDAAGRPARSFECCVLAPESAGPEIAAAILRKKPIGIRTAGSCAVTLRDDGGAQHEIRFSHAGQVAVGVRARVRVNAQLEADGARQIAERLAAHINGLVLGESVVLSALYSDVHAVTGVAETLSLELSADGGAWRAGNIAVGEAQTARADPANMLIEVEE